MWQKWEGLGRIGRDAELRHTNGGTAVANFSMVTTYGYGDSEDAVWHNIVVWQKLAEFAGERLKKGMCVFVVGRIQHRDWQDRDGNDRTTTEIVANEVKVTDWNDKNNNERSPSQGKPRANAPAKPMEPEEDIPF